MVYNTISKNFFQLKYINLNLPLENHIYMMYNVLYNSEVLIMNNVDDLIRNLSKEVFPKEKLQEKYFPVELILIKEGDKIRFGVHYYPGVKAVKVLHDNKDYYVNDVEFAEYVFVDPTRRCRASKDSKTPFKTHFVGDIAFGKIDETHNNPQDLKDLVHVIKPACEKLMKIQASQNNHMPLKDILAFEDKINNALTNTFEK